MKNMLNNRKKVTAVLLLALIFGLGFHTVREAWGPVRQAAAEAVHGEGTAAERLENTVTSVIDTTEEASVSEFYRKSDFIDLHGLVQRLMGRRTVEDAGQGIIAKDSSGKLHWLPEDQDAEGSAEKLIDLYRFCEERDKKFLYFAAPFKIIPGVTELPPSVEDHANPNLDRFLTELEEAGVPYVDYREQLKELPYPVEELFFNTDHHWRIETAFEAAAYAVKILGEMGYPLESHLDIEDYTQTLLEDYSLGSQGRRVGRLYAGLDDFNVITPNFETDYTMELDSWGTWYTREGSFEEAVMDQTWLSPELGPETVRYSCYLGGDHAETRITNHMVDAGDILVIQDSFGLPFSSFLSTSTHKLTILDMRHYKGSLYDYIEEHDPDVVMFLYNPDVFFDPMFSFEAH